MFIFAEINLGGLLKYMQCIWMGANRGAMGCKEYDVQYSLRKAQNPASSWGKWILSASYMHDQLHSLMLLKPCRELHL